MTEDEVLAKTNNLKTLRISCLGDASFCAEPQIETLRGLAASILRTGLFVILGFIVTSCGLYNRKWGASAEAGSFHDALLECVAAHDPNHIADIDQTGSDYRLSGWFVDEKRKAPVVQCMETRGWREVPVAMVP